MNEELTDNNEIDRDLVGIHTSHLPPLESLKQMTKEEKQEWIEKLKCISMSRVYKGIVLPYNEVVCPDVQDKETKGTTKKLRPV